MSAKALLPALALLMVVVWVLWTTGAFGTFADAAEPIIDLACRNPDGPFTPPFC